ncbi:hypothetical protein EAG18_20960 [Pseudoalteromonas sp. J010]|uniref:hypothetical protein n=1 Tax=Pseudoalteromonas sp. J010 TaxID=998465 RepID=UPI000F64E4E6|nr:hypothetical protein [Pseudoalteromonas sp. J010]RRS06681.1 hypothetical protein EAG18_20960 [Pseudoalteromonas sp. J010]
MKLKFNKKSIKELSVTSTMSKKMTPMVAGGNDLGMTDGACNSDQICWTFRNGQANCQIWNDER